VRENKDIRLFFALWPDEDLRGCLNDSAGAIPVERPARRVPPGNLHLTLHFIGNVYFEQLTCLQQQARLVQADAFEFNIDCRGYFSKPRVAWLGCSDPPTALVELHRQLGQRLRHCDYQPEKRRYNPHVTVARKIQPLPELESFEAISWEVENFALVEVCQTASGVQYCVKETFPLV
jgi:2'-5' RNA ligase